MMLRKNGNKYPFWTRRSQVDGQAIIAVSATVAALTRLVKWMGLPERFAPGVVMLLSAFGVLLWALTQPEAVNRTEVWSYFAGWIAVATSAAGVFGFTQSASETIGRRSR